MDQNAVQDFYADDLAWCYGCGRLNQEGFQLKTVWDGDETVTRFVPRPYHIAIPGYVYGGAIVSLIGRSDRRGMCPAAPTGSLGAGGEVVAVQRPEHFAGKTANPVDRP